MKLKTKVNLEKMTQDKLAELILEASNVLAKKLSIDIEPKPQKVPKLFRAERHYVFYVKADDLAHAHDEANRVDVNDINRTYDDVQRADLDNATVDSCDQYCLENDNITDHDLKTIRELFEAGELE